MGTYCSQLFTVKLKVDELLDNLPVFELTPREIFNKLNKLKKETDTSILESEFLGFVKEYACPSEFSHSFISFWKSFYAFKPEEDRDAHLMFGLILFSKHSKEKVDFLMFVLFKHTKFSKVNREAIHQKPLKAFISNVFKSYSLLTLRHLITVYEAKEDYVVDSELAFLECNVDKFIFEKYFPLENSDSAPTEYDLRKFLEENMHTFDKISSIRTNLREFEKVSENTRPIANLYAQKRLGDADSVKGN